jgi:hypothetical protein
MTASNNDLIPKLHFGMQTTIPLKIFCWLRGFPYSSGWWAFYGIQSGQKSGGFGCAGKRAEDMVYWAPRKSLSRAIK